MNSSQAPVAPRRPRNNLATFFYTLTHLAALGAIGSGIVALIMTLLGVGLGLLLVAGIGALFLLGFIYVLFGVSWLEVERVSGLYHLTTAPLRWIPQAQPGFGGYLRSLWSNLSQGRMWAAFGSFLLAVALGNILFQALRWFWISLSTALTPTEQGQMISFPFLVIADGGNKVWMWIAALICLLIAIGIVLLHRLICGGIIKTISTTAELEERVASSTRQREGAVRAADVERTRIERDLHDGVQPRLVSIGMTLGLAQQKLQTDPQSAGKLIDEAHASTQSAITELRQLTRGIYASVLEDRGLDAALSAIAARSHIPVQLDVRLPRSCNRTSEAAVYFAIAEALTNSAKHSRAAECRVTARIRSDGPNPALWARVEDNGIGGARVIPGGGLDGVANRVTAAGGTFHLDSPAGGPTLMEVRVPCAS